jgi:two-component system response regulator AtoC
MLNSPQDSVIIIDDEENLRNILKALMEREGFLAYAFASLKEAKSTLNEQDIDAVLTDLSMPEENGIDVLNYCKKYSPDLPVILMTAYGTVEAAVTALKGGAYDFILKPFEHEDLFRILRNAIQSRKRRKREPGLDPGELGRGEQSPFTSVIGSVPVPLFGDQPDTLQLRKTVQLLTRTRSSAVFEGEIGTGKRSIAFEIHRRSEFARGPFVQLNVDAIPDAFQISELFGFEKGAMPLSMVARPGRLELATRGTLLLEEVSALSIDAQNALLLALENEYFCRLGGVKRFPMDLRILCTTTENLSAKVEAGRFNPELYQKLAVQVVPIQPLRCRQLDLVTHLIPYFLAKACQKRGVPLRQLSPDQFQWAKNQKWEGNLGQLERWVQQIVND